MTVLTNGKKAIEFRNEKVRIEQKPISKFLGKKNIESIVFEDNSILPISGIFIAEGVAGSTDFARKLGAIVENEKIKVDEKMSTNIPGLYAAGDCTGGLMQIAKAVHDGAIAGTEAIKLLRNLTK